MSSRERRRRRSILLARDGNTCHWCNTTFDADTPPTIDHITPRSKNGRHALWNLVLACRPCNEQRGDTGLDPRRAAA